MNQTLIADPIAVSIGKQTRFYYPFVTTAPAEVDARSTVTLYAGSLTDTLLLAAEPDAFDAARAHTPTRLILVDATELSWQRLRTRSRGHRLMAADPYLVSRDALQRWLWKRLELPRQEEGRERARGAQRPLTH